MSETTPVDGPSGWKIQQVMAIWHERQKMLMSEDGEQSDEALKRAMEAQTGGLEAIQVWIVRAIRSAQAMAAAVKADRADLAVREKRFEARADGLRASLGSIIEVSTEPDKKTGNRRVVLPIATITLAPSGQKLEITDERNISDAFYESVEWVKVRKGLKRDELMAKLTTETVDEETGEILPPKPIEGVTLSNGSATLTIRGK